LDDHAFVATLKQMAAAKMAPIEPLGVGGAEPLHGFLEIGMLGFGQKVVMIIHQHIGEYADFAPFGHLPDRI
jgi:hypothetical protein